MTTVLAMIAMIQGRNKCCTNIAEDIGDEEAVDSPVDQLQ
jgi:hypothetical protein